MIEMPISKEILVYWCWKAARNYGDLQNGTFNNASFSNVIKSELNLTVPVDGNVIRLILTGRDWLKQTGNSYYVFYKQALSGD